MAEQTGGTTQLAPRPSSTSRPSTEGSNARPSSDARASRPSAEAVPLAAVSFVSGLIGLLVANLLLGPLAIVLGLVALRRDRSRRGRAVLGIVLGAADLAVFVLLAAHSGAHHGTLSWNFLGR